MVQPVKLYKKVTLVYLSHVMVATSVFMYIAYPELPFSIQAKFDKYLENLVNIGEFIRIKLYELADCIVAILKWGHRETSNYPYNPCTDSLLKRRIKRQRMNKATDWDMIISEYKLDMCCHAVKSLVRRHSKT